MLSALTLRYSKFIERLRHHQLDVLVTTTILERGITIDNVQVIIYTAIIGYIQRYIDSNSVDE